MNHADHLARFLPRRLAWVIRQIGPALLLALVTVLAMRGYLYFSSRVMGPGFPLDDAWIHQTYARSLAETGQWAYLPGEPSAGSTSPLWSLLLAVGYILHVDPLDWSYLLGGLSLWGLGLAGQALWQALAAPPDTTGGPAHRGGFPWAGLFLVGEWHLVWAALSGMETVLYALLITSVLALAARGRAWGWVGLLIGLGIWLRPDALTLLGPAGLVLVMQEKSMRARLAAAAWLVGGLLLLCGPYVGFNWQIQGSLLPNTFYAKQAEYALLQELPWLVRYADQLKLPLIGAGMLVAPGILRSLWVALQRRRWPILAAALWFLGFAGLYAWRLPVVYQHGRYLIPAMPVFFILGLAGMIDLAQNAGARRLVWVLTRSWVFSAAGLWLGFYGLAADSYASDVAIIQSEMVVTARWVAANTPPDALIAAHDIGALGYFGQRRLVDLAGLISPDVIPFMRDEVALARWLDQQQIDYLVTFPGWYETLTAGKQPVFHTNTGYSTLAGGENMWVFRWSPSP